MTTRRQHLADRGLLLVGQLDAGVLGLRADPLVLHPGDSSERVTG